MENPWKNISSESLVLECDLPYVTEHNKVQSALNRPQHVLETSLPPVPFLGMHEAPLVILLANPGLSEFHDKRQREPKNLEFILDAARTPGGTPAWPLTARGQVIDQRRWWVTRMKDVADVVGGFEELANRLLSIELHGYHSEKWSAPLVTFPSQHFNFFLVQQAMERGATIVIGRCQHHWYASVPGLSSYKNQVSQLLSPRSAYISRGNLTKEDFAKVENSLR